MRVRSLAFLLAVAFSAACVGTTDVVDFATVEQTTFADSLHIDLSKFTKLPSGMYTRDSVTGPGRLVALGDTVTTRYVGYLPDGRVFDQNAPPRDSVKFKLGAGVVIEGWDIGLQGMRVGGKRQLIIPPNLGYGLVQRGTLPPNSVLLFLVEVVHSP